MSNQASPLSLQDTGLTNGSVYTYQVSAINANGEGALSSPISEYPSTIPLPPANGVFALNSNAGANGNELTLVWDEDPVDVNLNGGSMLTMFRVTDSVGNLLGNINSQVDNPSYSFTIGSLTNGQNYSFRIYSINRDGVSGSYMLRYRTPLFEYAGQTPYMNDGKKRPTKSQFYKIRNKYGNKSPT